MNENIIVAITKLNEIVTDIDKDDTCFLDIKDTVEEVIALLKAKDTNVPTKWISVKDRLPEVDVDVLTIANVTGEHIAMVDCITETGSWLLQGGDDLSQVTHWRYLPEPPKEGEK